MPKFDDTPKFKKAMRWDPEAQKLVRPDRPPTRRQLDYLRRLCTERNLPFVAPKTRRGAQKEIEAVLQAKPGEWKFGVGQTAAQERAEIRLAQARGLEVEYMARQRWQRLREGELERRRESKRERRSRQPGQQAA
jgi:hypothetical protein